jgi:hypothetical protein
MMAGEEDERHPTFQGGTSQTAIGMRPMSAIRQAAIVASETKKDAADRTLWRDRFGREPLSLALPGTAAAAAASAAPRAGPFARTGHY